MSKSVVTQETSRLSAKRVAASIAGSLCGLGTLSPSCCRVTERGSATTAMHG